jgi:DNA-binding NarL/FixJ family response regulator
MRYTPRTKVGEGTLTTRQLTVLVRRAQGHRVKAIAAELGIAPKTVHVHCQQARIALKFTNLKDAIKAVRDAGLVPQQEAAA